MFTPNFTDPQFVDSSGPGGLNAAFGAVSGSINGLVSGAFAVPGLIAPEAMVLSYQGLSGTVALNAPWALVTSGGVLTYAHGTQTSVDTQTYAFDFTPLVPGTGTASGWLIVSGISIQQNPVAIPGPPPGHPSWNPNFVPAIGYATNVDSVAVVPTLTAPDNQTTFGLFSVLLTAGSINFTQLQSTTQFRAALSNASSIIATGSVALTPAQAKYILTPTANGQTITLPYANQSIGLTLRFVNTAASWTISAQSGDYIYGITDTSALTSYPIPQAGYLELIALAENYWYSLSRSFATPAFYYYNAGNVNFVPPAGCYYLKIKAWGAGGNGGYVGAANSNGAGGGAGGYAEGIIPVTPGQNIAISVASGGSVQNTTIGTYMTCTAGSNAAGSSPGTGGIGESAYGFVWPGGNGFTGGAVANGTNMTYEGGQGGASWGQPTNEQQFSYGASLNGVNAAFPGGGGNGGVFYGSAGSGANGFVILEILYHK